MISDKLISLNNTKLAIRDSILAKGGEVGDTFASFAEGIANIPSGGGNAVDENADLLFIDFDGTPLYGFTKEEGLAMTELPEPADHSGDEIPLVFDEWNYTLDDIMECLNDTGKATVGANYHTADGYTHFVVEQTEDGENSYGTRIVLENLSGVTIDWGDGNVETPTSTENIHVYAKAGRYDIKISGASKVSANIFSRIEDNSKYNIVTDVRYGYDITAIRQYNFLFCRQLRSVSVPSSCETIDNSAFESCNNLKSLCVPRKCNSTLNLAFKDCTSLDTLSISMGITRIREPFNSCRSLRRVDIPKGVTTIDSSSFYYCNSIKNILLPTSMVGEIQSSTFQYCYSMNSVHIPTGVSGLGSSSFAFCSHLKRVTIPSSVSEIGSTVFNRCYALHTIFLESTTPPTLSATTSLPANGTYLKKIVVPYSEDHSVLALYASSTNWSSFSDIMVEAEA